MLIVIVEESVTWNCTSQLIHQLYPHTHLDHTKFRFANIEAHAHAVHILESIFCYLHEFRAEHLPI
jgi:hypothetical protein